MNEELRVEVEKLKRDLRNLEELLEKVWENVRLLEDEIGRSKGQDD